MNARFISLFLLVMTQSYVFAQQYSVQWSEKEKGKGYVVEILPISGGDFLTIQQSKNSYSVTKHSNFGIVASAKLSTKLKGNVALFEDVKRINNQLVVFLSDRREGKDLFFVQKYGDDLKPIGEGIQLANYDLDRNYTRGSYNVICSQNNEFFAVIWNVPGKKDIQDKYGFKVFDKEFHEISEGDYKLPFEGKLSEINEHYLSNTGDYFISVAEFFEPENKKILKSYLNYKALHLFHVGTDIFDQYTLDLKGKRVESMMLNSDNNNIFTLTGIYGNVKELGASGLFFIRLDFAKSVILNEGFDEFGAEFITKDWTSRQKEKAEKQEVKGNGEPQLYNYKMRQSEILPDGSIVGSLEEYFVVTNTSYDSRGTARSTYSYCYNDIIAFKIGKLGGFEWLTKIPKEQVSSNDGGPYSGYCHFVDNGELVFIFNDDLVNYDEKGDFVEQPIDQIQSAKYGVKRNVVALVRVDVETGKAKRETFFDRNELDAIAVPKLFNVNYSLKEVLLYAIFRKEERFGLLKMKGL